LSAITIRPATPADADAIWEIFKAVIQGGDTYVYPADTPRQALDELWLAPHLRTYVAEINGAISGTYILKANYPGRGAHVANASYMVHPEAQGRGLGTAMCAHSLGEARRLGFRAMQFNLVVSTNTPAIHVWQKLGFEIVGTLPGAFRHRRHGYVDAYVMFRRLVDED
jgi:ribosomal protein S18 acetylase RimI-like enzyme